MLSTKILVSKDMIEIAKEYANQCIPFEFDRFGLDDQKRLEKIIIGTIGELVFDEYLKNTNLSQFVEFEFVVGRFDKFDFRIKGKCIDVKTSGFERDFSYLNLLYAVEPYHRKQYDFVVQVFIDGYDFANKVYALEKIQNGYIAGFAIYGDIKTFPKFNFGYAEDYKIPINKLIDINLLGQYV